MPWRNANPTAALPNRKGAHHTVKHRNTVPNRNTVKHPKNHAVRRKTSAVSALPIAKPTRMVCGPEKTKNGFVAQIATGRSPSYAIGTGAVKQFAQN
jgi:hypothetical protein